MQEEAGGLGPTQGDLSAHHSRRPCPQAGLSWSLERH